MKIFFEKYSYKSTVVKPFIDDRYLKDLSDNRVSIDCVGYFFSKEIDDTVFILPKVFIKVCGESQKAFGEYDPEDIIDTKNEMNPLLKTNFYNDVFVLSTWIYRAIALYIERNPSERISDSVDYLNVQSIKEDKSETWIDIILKLIRFNNEHQQLFTYIARYNSQGNNKISWGKTINHVIPVLQDGSPIYMRFVNKTKSFNFDEELLVLFYSVLDYLNDSFNIKIHRNVNYQTDPRSVTRLIESKKGIRLLRSIRRKYFKDELVELWNLLCVFFEKAELITSNRTYKEKLLVRDFNIVFEDMIDSLISDDTKIKRKELKDQPDGKVVDHIYRYESLFQNDDIYYVGDSKYYKESNNPDDYSIFKQFTYVKNVIQMNMDLWKTRKGEIGRNNYFDSLTEGYNISPNFFIRGLLYLDKSKNDPLGKINYHSMLLEAETKKVKNETVFDVEIRRHHENRLFDRDTLFVQKYSINFLYVLTEYALNNTDSFSQKEIHEEFRKNIITWLDKNYVFYKLTPNHGWTLKDAVEVTFKKLIGKIYCPNKENGFLILALEQDDSDNIKLLNDIKHEFIINDYHINAQ